MRHTPSSRALFAATTRCVGLMAVCLLFAMPGRAQETKLIADDAAAGDDFGTSVAISGDYALVGARFARTGSDDFGAAYVFKRTAGGWAQQAKLAAGDAEDEDRFGVAVALSGDYAVVGAVGEDVGGAGAGAAYVFARQGETWTQQAKLTAADANPDDGFGFSVAISGAYILVGAPGDDAVRTDAGAVYVFTRQGETWTQQAKLNAGDAVNGDVFGNAVALDGDYAVIGAVGDSFPDAKSGSAYVFVRAGAVWTEQAKIFASDGGENNFFGNAVALSGDHLIVGMSQDDDYGEDAGSAYIFARNGETWTRQVKLTASDATPADVFGHAVALSDAYAVVGAPGEGDEAGAAYVFKRTGQAWGQNCVTTTGSFTTCTETAKATASDARAGAEFGASAALSGVTALVGAPSATIQQSPTGIAYVLVLEASDTAVEQVGDEVPAAYRLDANYPNPFNPSTTLSFALPRAARVTLSVYDAAGALVAMPVDQRLAAGQYTTAWEATGLASGVYVVQMRAETFVQARTMILLK